MKIGLVAAAALLAFTVFEYALVTGPLKDAATREVEDQVARGQRLHSELARLEALDFTNLVATLSRRAGAAAIFDKSDETARRQAAFEECEAINGKLASQRKADIVAIVDAQGKVVARDLNVNAMFGEDVRKQFPAVEAAMKGAPAEGVASLSNRMAEVAAAPISKADGKLLGVLMIGYAVTARDAQARRDQLGADVGYFFDGKVQTSSFTEGTGPDAKEDGNRTHGLYTTMFPTEGHKPGVEALEKGAPTAAFRVSLDGQDYLAIAAPLHAKNKAAGFVVLQSLSHAEALAGEVGGKIFVFGLLGILIALAVAVMTANRFIKPLDKIELGVAEMINGNIDYTFKPVGPDFEGLSNSLNVMLARILGREEPNEDAVDEEENETQRWQSEHMVVDELPASAVTGQPSTDPTVVSLAAENEGAYYPRLFSEYLAALKSAGKPTKGLSVPMFTAKLRLIEGGLKQKWKCKQVRFRVTQSGGEVTLRPVPVF
ncbi:MAG: MXAN_5187 C-terminal domain-containing protein [Pseudomonadota bacterium]